MKQEYDGLVWDIEYPPIGSSTPDDLFELSYRATAECPNCGSRISGTAKFWSRDETMIGAWLNSVDYEECECHNDLDEWDDDEWDDEDGDIDEEGEGGISIDQKLMDEFLSGGDEGKLRRSILHRNNDDL